MLCIETESFRTMCRENNKPCFGSKNLDQNAENSNFSRSRVAEGFSSYETISTTFSGFICRRAEKKRNPSTLSRRTAPVASKLQVAERRLWHPSYKSPNGDCGNERVKKAVNKVS